MKIYIWGVGEHCDDRLWCYPQILEEVEGFVDSNSEKSGMLFYGKKIFVPDILREREFDLLLIAAQTGYEVIRKKCIDEYHIENKKIRTIDWYITNKLLTKKWCVGEACIDASTMCQLDCVQCYMRKDNYGAVGCGFLSFDNFVKFVTLNPQIRSIELANSGEVFLNPDLKKIIQYSHSHDIRLTAWDGVNFNNVSTDVLELLVKTQFRMITIALDGACQETYVKYRRGGDFDKVINNIRYLNELKRKYNTIYPKLNWQYIIMETTETDIVAAKALAKELGMTIKFRLTWDYSYVPKNVDYIRRETGLQYITRKDFDNNNGKKSMTGCLQLYTRPQFNWDGRMLGCKCIYQDDFGINGFEKSIKDIMDMPSLCSARELLKGKIENVNDEYEYPCKKCRFFWHMNRNQTFVTPEDFF